MQSSHNRINEGTRPQPSLAAAAITLCVSQSSVEKFHELMSAYSHYEKNPTDELGNYIALTMDAISLEMRITMAEKQIKKSIHSQNGTVKESFKIN